MPKQLFNTMTTCIATCVLSIAATFPGNCQQNGSTVVHDFNHKKEIAKAGGFFDIFKTRMTHEEREAMQFLYAYMCIGDLTDYSGEFYLENVRSSLQTRKESSWGNKIPDRIFRHFVLPIRVNNENLDDSREVFHKELFPKVKGMSMADAILEINHWCHEKVVYTPSDARTSSPLSTVKTAYGRCGEESTFLVAALRSVGIPARQVYTPRWAHTDDNHAWVEAWADGKWYFLGACEPEPVLNLGWFNAPASRGMLMHTKAFGNYDGPEEVMRRTANYTEINVIGNYATNAKTIIKVIDEQGKPVKGANVEFKIYNYAEFYTVSRQTTDSDGLASLSAGLGDMVAYASAGEKFGIRKISFGKDSMATLQLNHRIGDKYSTDIDIVPPAEKSTIPQVSPEQRAENTRRMHEEDSIRNAYIATFPTTEESQAFAEKLGLDKTVVAGFIQKSRGNHGEIMKFLTNAALHNCSQRAIDLLGTLSEKDLRDTPCQILEDHLYYTVSGADTEEVLAPRIAMEMLSPYRSHLQKAIPAELAKSTKADPMSLVDWCKKNLTLHDELNTVNTIISPKGVWESRITDRRSRDVFFVAACRSLGIRSWIDEVTGKVYYRDSNGQPIPVRFEAEKQTIDKKGFLKMDYTPIARLDNPKYYTHFTLSHYENGTFNLLNYPEDATWESLLKNGTALDAGYYMLTTGSRLANGNVLSNATFFNVNPNETTAMELTMRDNTEGVRVIGNFNSESTYTTHESTETSVLATTGRGYFLVGILGYGQEPTNHALKDIEKKKAEFEEWGRPMLLLFTDTTSFKKFDSRQFPDLPSTVRFGVDTDGKIREQICENMKIANSSNLPIFIVGDTFNRVVFESDGYTIGLGEQLMKIIDNL